ncbi:MAG TPA: hypothetical protein VM163_09235 [bacterium]|nr:hypothetical protein [bacterium]
MTRSILLFALVSLQLCCLGTFLQGQIIGSLDEPFREPGSMVWVWAVTSKIEQGLGWNSCAYQFFGERPRNINTCGGDFRDSPYPEPRTAY